MMIIISLCTTQALAQCIEKQKLTASDAADQDRFGNSVSIAAGTVVVGAPSDDCAAGNNCGAAYTYTFSGNSWVEQQKLTATEAGSGDWFGTSVSVSEDTIFVGAPNEDCASDLKFNCGAVYVFRFNGTSWVREEKIIASDGMGGEIVSEGDGFGISVSIDGITAVVGSVFKFV